MRPVLKRDREERARASRQASQVDEKLHQKRVQEMADGAYSFVPVVNDVITTYCVEVEVSLLRVTQVLILWILGNRTHPHVDSSSVL